MPMNRFLLVIGVAALASVPVVRAGPLAGAARTAPFSLESEPPPANSSRAPLDIVKDHERRLHLAIPLFSPSTLAPESSEGENSADIDLSALRYFVSQGDTKRVSAEIHLIRSKHPDWQPDEDLFAESAATIDESSFWAKFAAGDYAGVHADIDKMKAERPEWQPSGDLANKLATAEAYQAMILASQDSRWRDVLKIAADSKSLLTCNYLDALWRVAEALARTEDEPRAAKTYTYILTNCRTPEDRLATAHKAVALLKSPALIDQVLALGLRGPDGRDEFESARFDLVRQTIGAAAANIDAPRADPQQVSAFTRYARDAAAPDDEMLLGWYAYAQKDYPAAEDLFRKANSGAPSAKAAEGLVRSLVAQDKNAEALQTAIKFYSLGLPNKTLLAETLLQQMESQAGHKMDEAETAALSTAINDTKDANAAQRLGWRLYNAGEASQAREWFAKSTTWSPSEPAALGLLASNFRLKDFLAYDDVAAKYRAQFPKVAEYVMHTGRYLKISHNKTHGKVYRSAARVATRTHLAHIRRAGNSLALTGSRSAEHVVRSAIARPSAVNS